MAAGVMAGVDDAQSGQPISLLAEVNRVVRGSNNVNMTLTEFLLHVETDQQQYYVERLKEYEAMLHVIGVLAGVIGTEEEQTQLRQAVMTAVENYLESIYVAADPKELYLEGLGGVGNERMVIAWLLTAWFGFDGARETIEAVGRRNHEINQMVRQTITGFFKSIWSSLVDWWNKFWETYEKEGLLIALNHARIDVQFFAAECALDIAISAALAGAGVAVAAALKGLRFVGQRVGRGVTRIVIHAIPDNAKHINPQAKVLHQLDLPDNKIDPKVDRLLDEDKFKLPEQATTPQPSTPQTTRIKGNNDNHADPNHPNAAPTPRKPDFSRISARDRELARSPGNTREQRKARKNVVTIFSEETGVEKGQLHNMIDPKEGGIDLTKPLEIKKFKQGDKLTMWYDPERGPGNWVDPIGNQHPSHLGISPEGRIQRTFIMEKDGYALESSSKRVIDKWTNKEGKLYQTEGGGIQWFIPNDYKPTLAELRSDTGLSWLDIPFHPPHP